MSAAAPDLPPGTDLHRDAVHLCDRVWWVGHPQHDDGLQCHVYLIEQGDQSVLVDPGSSLTFRHSLRKIEQVVPFSSIRYFICHHQDPDIAGALPVIDQLVSRDDAVVVSHWRAKALLRHYGLQLPFWLVEDHEWRLELADRSLRFVFTPYAHFPGAFCSFDERNGILFSSDLFGGFTDEFALVAEDEGYFEALRPFHEHYMPSRDILEHAINQMEPLDIRLIAPQHGSIIPEQLVRPMMARLKRLECGLYLMAGGDTNIQRLSQLNQALRDFTETLVVSRDFQEVARRLLEIVQRLLPVRSLEFYASFEDGRALHLAPETRYRGVLTEPPVQVRHALSLGHERQDAGQGALVHTDGASGDGPGLLLPLRDTEAGAALGVALMPLTHPVEVTADIERMVEQMTRPLTVALEREVTYRSLDMERQRLYERSIRDPLTGLFNRFYMQDAVQRLLHLNDRDPQTAVALALLDIDHFKAVNDSFGHEAGDAVLRQIGALLKNNSRGADIPVRIGGEEFAVFLAGHSASGVDAFAERIRADAAAMELGRTLAGRRITVSVGTASRRPGEDLEGFMARADRALYAAKQAGRDQTRSGD